MNKKAIFIVLATLILVVIAFLIKQFNVYPSLVGLISKRGPENLVLQEVKDVSLAGGADRLDYQSIDYGIGRLYISHLGSSMVHVFDLKKQQVVADITLPSSPYGILAVSDLNTVYVSVGGSNQVGVIDESTLKVIKYIPAGTTPDGIAYSPQTKKIFVSNENGGTVTVIDAQTDERMADIPIGGGVGNTQSDVQQNKIYTAAGEDNKLVEIDPVANKIVNKYNLPGCSRPHGFYIDEQTRYAFITCQINNVMVVFDLDSKKVISSDTVGALPDVLAYDIGLHHLYISGEAGVMSIFDVQKGTVKKIHEGFIADRAHTVAVDQKTHYVYLPIEDVSGKPTLRVLRPL